MVKGINKHFVLHPNSISVYKILQEILPAITAVSIKIKENVSPTALFTTPALVEILETKAPVEFSSRSNQPISYLKTAFIS